MTKKKSAQKHSRKVPQKLQFIGLTTLLIFGGLAFLIATPRVVTLAESRIVESSNEIPQNAAPVKEVAGVEKKPQVQIVSSGLTPPQFTSKAVFAEDLDTGQILFQKNIHTRLSPASTTKIMTALIGEEKFLSGDVLNVPPGGLVGGSTMGLKVGETATFRSILYGMLLNSGNDAAYTIALNYPGGFSSFIDRMNQKVSELGLTDTNFTNPAGFDNPNHYSSAYDLAKIAEAAIKNIHIAKIVATKETSIVSYDKEHAHQLKNLNVLLDEPGVLGIKTGFTEIAGENFVGLVDRNGHKVLTVVLASQDRFGETKALMDWVYKNFQWEVQ